MDAGMEPPRRLLLIGYGNPGRLDDGLGPACAAAIEARAIPGVTVDSNYQLTVEDAASVAASDAVVFVDAAVAGDEPFEFRTLAPSPAVGIGTHSLEPAAVLALAQDVFGAAPPAYIMAIRGYEFSEFGETLSAWARRNLDAAIEFLDSWLRARIAFAVPVAQTTEETP